MKMHFILLFKTNMCRGEREGGKEGEKTSGKSKFESPQFSTSLPPDKIQREERGTATVDGKVNLVLSASIGN